MDILQPRTRPVGSRPVSHTRLEVFPRKSGEFSRGGMSLTAVLNRPDFFDNSLLKSIVGASAMKVVLATPPSEGDTWGIGSFPTLGLLYLAGSVRDLPDVQVTVVDPYAEGLDSVQAARRILSYSPDMFGVTVNSQNIRRAWRLISRIKAERPDVLTIFGGHHATLFDRLVLREISELDLILRGEAEESFRELCRRLLRSEDIASVPGLSYRSGGEPVSGTPQMIEDMDSVPFPDRDTLEYRGYFTRYAGFRLPKVPMAATMITSRGCPYACTFCSKTPPMSNRWRPRSARNVLKELLQLSEEGYQLVLFVDENFTRNIARVDELSRLILEHRLQEKMRLGFQGSLHDVPQETLDVLHEAGFDFVFVGVESGSEAQLSRYRKPVDRNGLAEGVRRAKKAHMVVVTSFITGAPGETEEDLRASREFVLQVRPHAADSGPLIIDPGTPLWEEMMGPGEPKTLDDSLSRPIYEFSDQPEKQTIDERIVEFRRAFSKSWLHWRRGFDFYDLLRYNPSVRYVLKMFVKDPAVLLQFFKRGSAPVEIVVK
jgi:anaerobic magnesium-protoporphyrin IX monomethyl ester cyclase